MILKCQKFLGFHLTNRAKKPLRGASSQLGIPYAPDAEGRVDVCVTQSIAHHLRPSEPSGITKSSPEQILASYKANRKHQNHVLKNLNGGFLKWMEPPLIIHL